MKWLPTLTFLVFFAKYAHSYIVTVDAHAEECFFDMVEAESKMSLSFIIMEGGFLDIDVKIVGPDGKTIYEGFQENNGKNTFKAHMNGKYTYCFSNLKRSMTSKVIMFNMEIEEPSKHNESKTGESDENHGKLDDMIKELSASLIGVKTEQEYMQIRDRNHRAINENTNFRVGLWSMFEATALVCMTLGQIYYLKRFFEVRRVV